MQLNKLMTVMVVSSALVLSGCSAMGTAIKKRNLEVKTQMSETIWLACAARWPNINVTFLPTYAPRGWRMKRMFAGAVRRSIRTGVRSNTSGQLTARNPLITSSLRSITITT